MTKSHKGLVLKEIEVKRGGKVFKQKRWIKADKDEPKEKPSKKEAPKGKESFKVGSKLSLMGKDLTIEKVSESEKTIKLSDGKVYTFDAIDKGSKIKKDKESKIKIKPKKIDTKNLSKQMELYKSGIKFHPEGNDMITAINDYSDVNYMTINSYLRDEKSNNEKNDKEIEHISNFLRYAPKMSGMVYRGMTFGNDENGFNEFLNDAKEGKSVMMKAFISTSTDESIISEFRKGNYTISFEIKSKSGVYLNGLAEVPEENEVLFDKKSKFNIIKVDKSDSKHIKIIMEEM